MKSYVQTKRSTRSNLQNVVPKNTAGRGILLRSFEGLDVAQAHNVLRLDPAWLIVGNIRQGTVANDSHKFNGSQQFNSADEWWFKKQSSLSRLGDFSEDSYLPGKAASNMYHSLSLAARENNDSLATYIILGTILQHKKTKLLGCAQRKITFVTHERKSSMTQKWNVVAYKYLAQIQLHSEPHIWVSVIV